MVPTSYVTLAALPLTASGKTNRRALPDPTTDSGRSGGDPPSSDTEHSLAAIWSALLGVPDVSRDDNFFDRGGHSLLAIRAISRIRDTFGVEMPLTVLFDTPTLAAVAGVVDTLQWVASGARPADVDDVEEMML
jgi:hypothetical protein